MYHASLKMYFGQRFHTPNETSKEYLHVENVVRSTLSYPNENSKECIQFFNTNQRFSRVSIMQTPDIYRQ
jgi:hypothetical protein